MGISNQEIIEILIRARDEASAKLDKVRKSLRANGHDVKATSAEFKNYQKTQSAVIKQTHAMRREFDGAAMSLMFFGMAMQRIGTKIWTQGTKTFQDVMHSVSGTVTQFDRLNAHGEALKYSLGAALEPLAGMLIPIVMAVTDWISEHEQLVRIITGTLAVGGTVIMAYGMVKLALDGVVNKTKAIWTSFQDLQNKPWSSVASSLKSKIAGAVGVISIGYALVQAAEAYKDFEDGTFTDGLLNAMSAGFLGYGGIKLLKGQKGGGVLVAIGVGLDLLEQNKFFTTIASVAGLITAVLATTINYIRELFSNGIKEGLVNGVIEFLGNTKIAKLLNLIPGFNVKSALSSLAGIGEVEFDWWDEFKQAYAISIAQGKQWDAQFAEFKAEIDALAEGVNAGQSSSVFYDPVSGGAPFTFAPNYTIIATSQDELQSMAAIPNQQSGGYI